MRIIADVMGSDKGARELVKGACDALREYDGIELTLVGDSAEIKVALAENKVSEDKVEIVHTDVVIEMCDNPLCVNRAKADSSMSIGLKMLKEGKGDAFVSAGNTGALFTGATLIVRKIKGVNRPAIATVLPMTPPVLLLDSGANIVVTPDQLLQFAVMGGEYMKKLYGVKEPRVGLLNNGSEESKGTALQLDTYKLFKESSEINFVGNVEGNRLPQNACDVLVTDGFTGNILLKTMEGMGKLMKSTLTSLFKKNVGTMIAYLFVRKNLDSVKKNFDSSEHGGAPILGVTAPVIKAHGSSNAKAYKNAIRQAAAYAKTGMIEELTEKASILFAKKKTEENKE